MMRIGKIFRALGKGVICLAIGIALAALTGRYVIDPLQYHAEFWLASFDSAVWKAETATTETHHTKRRSMIHDLTKNHFRKGMLRAEVVGLCGEPMGQHGGNTLDYWLGYPRWWFTFDHDILEVFLDETGKVTGWKVRNT